MKKRSGFLSLMAIALLSTHLPAQSCKTDSLIVNTGYDPVAHAPLLYFYTAIVLFSIDKTIT